MTNNVCIQGPAVEPITVDEAKAQLNIDPLFTDDDTFIGTLIAEARQWCEDRTGQCFIKQKRVQYMDSFPLCGKFSISNGPIMLTGTGVVAPVIKYYDSNDAQQTWSDTNYWLDVNRFEPIVKAKYSWPSLGDRPSGISFEYYAGFGVGATTVPVNVKRAIKFIVAHLYNNRTPEVEIARGEFAKIEMGVERMLTFDTRLTYAGNS